MTSKLVNLTFVSVKLHSIYFYSTYNLLNVKFNLVSKSQALEQEIKSEMTSAKRT